MNKIEKVLLGIGLVGLIGVIYSKSFEVSVPKQDAPVVNVSSPSVNVPSPIVNVSVPDQRVGAVPTLDGVDSPNVRVGGLGYYYYSQSIAATSSTICSVRVAATSTIAGAFTVNVRSNSMGYTPLLDIATSTTQTGTSTPAFVKAYTVPLLGSYLTWFANSTTTGANVIGNNVTMNSLSDVVVFPGQFINVKLATSTPGTFAAGYLTGTCSALIQKL